MTLNTGTNINIGAAATKSTAEAIGAKTDANINIGAKTGANINIGATATKNTPQPRTPFGVVVALGITLAAPLLPLVAFVVFVASPTPSRGAVYVYEVNTLERRYVTVSRLLPDAYRYYNGGDDVIAELIVLKTYPNGNYQQAMEDYNIQGNNYGPLPPQDAQHNLSFRPYIWWR